MTRKEAIEQKAEDIIKQSKTIGFGQLVEMAEWADQSNVATLKEMQDVHYQSTKPMDDYFTGMYNGMEYSISIIGREEPVYKDCKK